MIILNKNFDEFLKTIDDKELIRKAADYMTTAIVTNEKEKELLYNVAIQKSLLNKYHQWLNS